MSSAISMTMLGLFSCAFTIAVLAIRPPATDSAATMQRADVRFMSKFLLDKTTLTGRPGYRASSWLQDEETLAHLAPARLAFGHRFCIVSSIPPLLSSVLLRRIRVRSGPQFGSAAVSRKAPAWAVENREDLAASSFSIRR